MKYYKDIFPYAVHVQWMFTKLEGRGAVYIIYLTWVIQHNSATHCDGPGDTDPERHNQLGQNLFYSALLYGTEISLTKKG
jgi:hypothetical protein